MDSDSVLFCLSPLHIIIVRFIRVVACSNSYSSLLLHSVPFYIVPLPVDGYLDCFQFLAITNKPFMNSHVPVFKWVYVFMSLGLIVRSGIAGPYGRCMFHFFEKLPKCSPKRQCVITS